MSDKPRLIVVVPCYNEGQVLPVTSSEFYDQLKLMIDDSLVSNDSRIMYVDDGSTDSTWDIIKELSKKDPHYIGIRQSRNRGHQSALMAGLMESVNCCDISISIDCDGQDDVRAMSDMVRAYAGGSDVVYGVRRSRKTDTFWKRFTALAYYKILQKMGVEIVNNHADYRLLSNRVMVALSQYKEVNLFLRGMIPLVGFKSSAVYYDRKRREAGKTHYSLSRMFALAVEGITSLSVKPIRVVTVIGFAIALLSFLGVIWVIVGRYTGHTMPGWASTTSLICLVSGIQMICTGVIGEYIGKIYLEVKHRPRFIIMERTYGHDERSNNDNIT